MEQKENYIYYIPSQKNPTMLNSQINSINLFELNRLQKEITNQFILETSTY